MRGSGSVRRQRQTAKRFDACRRAHRSLVVIDADNITGGTRGSDRLARADLGRALDLAELADTDHLLVGSNASQAVRIATALRSRLGRCGQFVVGLGPDGADLAILRAIAADGGVPTIAKRYSRVVLVSGDHIFSWLIRGLEAAGSETWVVSRRASLSERLQSSASVVRTFRPCGLSSSSEASCAA